MQGFHIQNHADDLHLQFGPYKSDTQYSWATGHCHARFEGFTALFEWNSEQRELQYFYEQLQALSRDLSGQAQYLSMESQLTFTLEARRLGQLCCRGELRSAPASSHRLNFEFMLDQSHLPPLLRDIEAILHHE